MHNVEERRNPTPFSLLYTAAWELPIEIGPKMVLLWLVRRANEYGMAWPSQSDIVAHCAVSERTAINCLQQLEAEGFIQTRGWATLAGGSWKHCQGAYEPGRGRNRLVRVLPRVRLPFGEQPDPRASDAHQEGLPFKNGHAPRSGRVQDLHPSTSATPREGCSPGHGRVQIVHEKGAPAAPKGSMDASRDAISIHARARATPHVDPATPGAVPSGPAILDGAVSSSNGVDPAAQSLAALYKIIIADPSSNARQRVEAHAKLEELAPRLNPHPATGAGPRTPADPVLANAHRNGG